MIRTEIDGPVATVTVDRPDKKNALTLAMRQEREALPSTLVADLGPGTTPSDPAGGLRALPQPTIGLVDHGLGVDLDEAVRHEKEIAVQHGAEDLTIHLEK